MKFCWTKVFKDHPLKKQTFGSGLLKLKRFAFRRTINQPPFFVLPIKKGRFFHHKKLKPRKVFFLIDKCFLPKRNLFRSLKGNLSCQPCWVMNPHQKRSKPRNVTSSAEVSNGQGLLQAGPLRRSWGTKKQLVGNHVEDHPI